MAQSSHHDTQASSIRFGAVALTLLTSPPARLVDIVNRISSLGDLPTNWDSYGAKPIRAEAAQAATELVLKLLAGDAPLPDVVPLVSGGIQLEWHRAQADLEIEILSASDASYSFEDLLTSEEETGPIHGNTEPLIRLLKRLSASE